MLADPASEPSPDHPQTYQPNVDNGKLGGRSVCHSRAMTRSGRVHCPSKSNSTTTVKALKRSKIQMAQQDTDQHSDQHTPFMVQQEPGLSREISQEDVSDGLSFCRRRSWFLPSYTRKDCRCGSCSIGDTEPCPYARPQVSVVDSVMTIGRRSLSRLLSHRLNDLGKEK